MVLSLFVTSLFFGVFTALLASNKNRNILGWFFIGLIFGPFGLLFAFFMKDGKELEVEEKKRYEKETYYYEVRPKKRETLSKEWKRINKFFYKLLGGEYIVKQYDSNIKLLEVSKTVYIKIYKSEKIDEKGFPEVIFKVDSIKYGNINFGDDFEVISMEKEENHIDESGEINFNIPSMDSSEKLIKLAEMLEKGLITEEEFKKQKEVIL
jgi:hypothetical protein